jgi:hypothetical protein
MTGKNKLKPAWKFSQKGNLWKFIFAGKKYIAGETRDIARKTLYLFAIRIEDGKKILTDFKFDGGNYWISLEAANETTIFLSRFGNPELPYPKDIIAIDIKTGKLKWENTDYVLYFCTEKLLYGYKRKFESVEYVKLNIDTGEVEELIPESNNPSVAEMKEKSDTDLYGEFYDYPKPVSLYPPDGKASEIIRTETGGEEISGDIEYIIKNDKLFFNYYVKALPDLKNLNKNFYKNIFCIYCLVQGNKIFEEVLNEKSAYNVPDNFFSRDNRVFYLVEKKELKSIVI